MIPGYDFGDSNDRRRLLTIKTSRSLPVMPFVSVFYRGVWFTLDRDLDSKRTFALLTYIMSLQSTSGARSPRC